MRREMRTARSHLTQQTEPPEMSMSDPRIALRALQQIRGGRSNPVQLARQAVLSRGAPQDYYDPEQEALDSMDEMDPEAYATPGDPFPDRPFDPGDESRAAAIRAYNTGPKPGADPRGFLRDDERGEAMMGIDDDEAGEYDDPVYEDVSIGMPSSVRSAGVSGNPRGYGPAYNYAQQRAAEFAPYDRPQTAADAVNDLGPIFAGLQNDYATRTARPTSPMAERYMSASRAPQVGGTPEEMDPARRRLLAGR